MDENMRSTIASIKAIIETTRQQLKQMEQEENPDQHLLLTVQNNHEQALSTLRTLKKINGGEAVAAILPAGAGDREAPTGETSQAIDITRHVSHAFQVIPPREESLGDFQTSTPAKSQAQSDQPAAMKKPASSSTDDVQMTREEYMATLKKKGKKRKK